jgi:hypothetical protein
MSWPPPNLEEIRRNKAAPDRGRALYTAWLIRDVPGISRKALLRRLGYFQPGEWDGVRNVLRGGIRYSAASKGWHPTNALGAIIDALQTELGVEA